MVLSGGHKASNWAARNDSFVDGLHGVDRWVIVG